MGFCLVGRILLYRIRIIDTVEGGGIIISKVIYCTCNTIEREEVLEAYVIRILASMFPSEQLIGRCEEYRLHVLLHSQIVFVSLECGRSSI